MISTIEVGARAHHLGLDPDASVRLGRARGVGHDVVVLNTENVGHPG